MKLPSRETARWLCWSLFFPPFVLYFLIGSGDVLDRPPALDAGIITVSAALGGLVLNAGLNLKGSKRKETVEVAQEFIAVVILMILFLPSLHFVELMDGIDLDSFQPDSLEAWFRGFFFWVGAVSFYLGISVFILALVDLVYAMRGIGGMEHALGGAREVSGQESPDDDGSDSGNQDPRYQGTLTGTTLERSGMAGRTATSP